jgi:hypothetical protein
LRLRQAILKPADRPEIRAASVNASRIPKLGQREYRQCGVSAPGKRPPDFPDRAACVDKHPIFVVDA